MSLYANICVTVTRYPINKWFGTCPKCHCKRGVTVNGVTVSGEVCILNSHFICIILYLYVQKAYRSLPRMSLYEIFTLNVAHCIHIYPNFETETHFNANFIRILSEIYSKVVIVALFFIPSSLRKCRASSPLSKFCCRSSVRTSEFGADGEKRKKFEPRVPSRADVASFVGTVAPLGNFSLPCIFARSQFSIVFPNSWFLSRRLSRHRDCSDAFG